MGHPAFQAIHLGQPMIQSWKTVEHGLSGIQPVYRWLWESKRTTVTTLQGNGGSDQITRTYRWFIYEKRWICPTVLSDLTDKVHFIHTGHIIPLWWIYSIRSVYMNTIFIACIVGLPRIPGCVRCRVAWGPLERIFNLNVVQSNPVVLSGWMQWLDTV